MNDICLDLLKHKIVVIVRNVPSEKLSKLFDAFYDGNIKFAEITLNSEDALNSIKLLSEKFKNKMYVGAGTVLNIEQAKNAVEHGAQFIVTPNTNVEVIKYCIDKNIMILPGAMTPTEIVTCIYAGASFVKIFPASSLGAKYIKELKGPLNNVHMLPVGGVTLSNIDEFLESGASGFGIGGNICNLKLIEENKFDEIMELAKSYNKKVLGV